MTEDRLAKTQQVEALRRSDSEECYQPSADIRETGDEIILEFDMPGVAKDSVEVTVEQGILRVTGEASAEEPGQAVYRETRVGDYRREFTLRDDIDADRISGEIRDGVLTVRIGKPQAAKPRQIAIKQA